MYKREFFRRPNPVHNIDIGGGNIHLSRLRLGLSHLSEHLYTHNIIDSPLCKNCELESESIAHYLLKCPCYGAQRAKFLSDLLTILDGDHIANLSENDIVNLFCMGTQNFHCNLTWF